SGGARASGQLPRETRRSSRGPERARRRVEDRSDEFRGAVSGRHRGEHSRRSRRRLRVARARYRIGPSGRRRCTRSRARQSSQRSSLSESAQHAQGKNIGGRVMRKTTLAFLAIVAASITACKSMCPCDLKNLNACQSKNPPIVCIDPDSLKPSQDPVYVKGG